MELDKGRAKPPKEEIGDDSLEGKLLKLSEINTELKREKKQYLDKTKHLRDIKKSLETIITEEVKKLKKSVTVGNIRAEYVPQVQFRMKKEVNDGE